MTADELSRRIGVPRRTLFRYRKDHPERAPRSFDDIEGWLEFVLAIKNYPADRTRPRDRNGTEPVPSSAKNGDSEYSARAERKERIIRLRLGNDCRRTSLERLRRNTVTTIQCIEAMECIRAVLGADLVRLPRTLCHDLANRDPQYIQQVLDAAFRSALERLSQPETYLDSIP
jgi:hypothetical protein